MHLGKHTVCKMHHVPECRCYHGVIGGLVITGRAHSLSFWLSLFTCSYIYIYIYIDFVTTKRDYSHGKRWGESLQAQKFSMRSIWTRKLLNFWCNLRVKPLATGFLKNSGVVENVVVTSVLNIWYWNGRP